MLESGNIATNMKSPTSMQTQTTRELKNTSANETLLKLENLVWLAESATYPESFWFFRKTYMVKQ